MVALRYLVGFIVSFSLMASALEAVQISLPEVTAAAGERVRIPVQISSLADGDEILSSNLDVRFDTGIIPIDKVTVDRKGNLRGQLDRGGQCAFSAPKAPTAKVRYLLGRPREETKSLARAPSFI